MILHSIGHPHHTFKITRKEPPQCSSSVFRKLLEIHGNERRENVSSREWEQQIHEKSVSQTGGLVRGTWRSCDTEERKSLVGACMRT